MSCTALGFGRLSHDRAPQAHSRPGSGVAGLRSRGRHPSLARTPRRYRFQPTMGWAPGGWSRSEHRLPPPNDRRPPLLRASGGLVATKGYWAPKDLDHRDRNKTNCAIGNLRPATKAQNNANRRTRPGKDGAPRGCRLNRSNKYQVQIEAGGANGKRGRSIYLGSFATAEEAGRVYREAAADLHGEFASSARPERRAA